MAGFNTGVAYSFLHVCGGDPGPIRAGNVTIKFSPRMWR